MKNTKKYDIMNYYEINKVPKEIKEIIPEKLLKEYFYNIKDLKIINKKITEYTKRWVETQEETIKIEKSINKLLEQIKK